VMARGVDTELFSPRHRDSALRSAWGAAADTVVMLCVGRIAAEKNLGLLHDAWQAAQRRGLRVKLVVVGDGPMRAELERQWPGVFFTGLKRGHELAGIYASADLFVFPSLTETYGNVVPEAMASGLPVVAFNCAAASQLIQPGLDGQLADCDKPEQFVELACQAASSAASCSAMGVHARARVQAQGWDRIVNDLERLMLDLVENHGITTRSLEWRPAMN
jgi:glycosyltransferase involved in cell wall biosynthesis